MSLITCNECKGTVSTLAKVCPHCGAPVVKPSNPFTIYYDGEEMDAIHVVAAMYNNDPNTKRKIWDMCGRAGIAEDDLTISGFIDQIYAIYQKIYGREPTPIELFIPPSPASLAQEEFEDNQRKNRDTNQIYIPRCPTCGSTDLIKKNATARAMDGFVFGRLSVEGRAQWKCKKCGHLW